MKYRSKNGRLFDPSTLVLLFRPFQCPLRSMFPKINSMSEPVILILAGIQITSALYDLVTYR